MNAWITNGAAEGDGTTLLVDALRRTAGGQGPCALTRHDFAIAFPGDADEVFATFRAFLGAVAYGSPRKLRIGPPGSPHLLPDEISLLGVLAAAQTGDDALFDAHLCWLARPGSRPAVAVTTRALATAFAVHGKWLCALQPCHSGASRRDEPGTHEHDPMEAWRSVCSWVPDSKARYPES